MPIRLGELNAILSPRVPTGTGAASVRSGLGTIRQSARNEEDDRRARASESLASRRQDEVERAAGSREGFARDREMSRQTELARNEKRKAYDDIIGLQLKGMATEAARIGEMYGIDLERLTPEQFIAERDAVVAESEQAADVEAADAGAAEAEDWIAGSDEGLEARVSRVYDDSKAQSPEAGVAAVNALDKDLEGYLGALAQGARASGALGMGVPQATAQPVAPSPGPAPDQRTAQPQAATQMAMGVAPRPQVQRPSPQPQAAAMGMGVPSPSALRSPDGQVFDPLAGAARVEAWKRAEKLARVAAPIQRALIQQSTSPSLTEEESNTYVAFAESFPDILTGFDMDVDKALEAMAGGEALGPVLDRALKRDLAKKRGGRKGGGDSGDGGDIDQKQYDVGRRMTEKQMSKQGFNVQGARTSLGALEGALRDIASKNPTQQAKGLKFLASAREEGKVTDRDMLDLLGKQNFWESVTNERDRWVKGGLGKVSQDQLVATMTIGIRRSKAKLATIRKHAEEVHRSAVARGGDYHLGTRGFINEVFGKEAASGDAGEAPPEKKAAGDDAQSKPSALGSKHGY